MPTTPARTTALPVDGPDKPSQAGLAAVDSARDGVASPRGLRAAAISRPGSDPDGSAPKLAAAPRPAGDSSALAGPPAVDGRMMTPAPPTVAQGRGGAIASFDDTSMRVAPAPQPSPITLAVRALELATDVVGGASVSQPSRASRPEQAARSTIVVMSAVLGAWLISGTVAALGGLVRVLHGGDITVTESALLSMGCLVAAITPAWLYVAHVKRVVWPSSVRALELAIVLKRITTAVLVTYGGLSMLARIVHAVIWRSSVGIASGVWDIALFAVSVASALTMVGFGPLLRHLQRSRRG